MKLLLIYFPTATKRDVTWKMLGSGADETPCIPLLKLSTISLVVPSVLHLLQRLSHIKFRLHCEQYKRFKTRESSREMRAIYDINPRYKMKFHTCMQRWRTVCFVDTLSNCIVKFSFRVFQKFLTLIKLHKVWCFCYKMCIVHLWRYEAGFICIVSLSIFT